MTAAPDKPGCMHRLSLAEWCPRQVVWVAEAPYPTPPAGATVEPIKLLSCQGHLGDVLQAGYLEHRQVFSVRPTKDIVAKLTPATVPS